VHIGRRQLRSPSRFRSVNTVVPVFFTAPRSTFLHYRYARHAACPLVKLSLVDENCKNALRNVSRVVYYSEDGSARNPRGRMKDGARGN